MAVFSKESLEALRAKVDLVEVVAPYVRCKKVGSTYKALCPFHGEKSPSFIIDQGDSHYHCFGCGAHGDAIAFLMNYLKLTFVEAVEVLAEKFGVALEKNADPKERSVDYSQVKKALHETAQFFHFHLLHTDEGHQAMQYLFKRGIDLPFIKQFTVGFSPKDERFALTFFREKRLKWEDLELAGLVKKNQQGKWFPFFSNRIMFPIMDMTHNTIGFSARKIHEETYGGKYINTAKTPLFNKSKVLFGLNYSRFRIAKEGKAIIVEGQIDALRLIQVGLDYTVASQGTAFGEGHVDQLRKVGVKHVYLAFDGDDAGLEATVKVGQLFQIEGIEVSVVILPKGLDPDAMLREFGAEGFKGCLDKSIGFIPFLVTFYRGKIDSTTPAGKNEMVRRIATQIREWKHPIMVHEGLKILSSLLQVPERMIGVEEVKPLPVQRSIDPNQIIELDFLRWLVLLGRKNEMLWNIAQENVDPEQLLNPACQQLFRLLLAIYRADEPLDFLNLGQKMAEIDEKLLEQIISKKVNTEKAVEGITDAVQKILERNWMLQRENIKKKIQTGSCSDTETLALAREFDALQKARPRIILQKEVK